MKLIYNGLIVRLFVIAGLMLTLSCEENKPSLQSPPPAAHPSKGSYSSVEVVNLSDKSLLPQEAFKLDVNHGIEQNYQSDVFLRLKDDNGGLNGIWEYVYLSVSPTAGEFVSGDPNKMLESAGFKHFFDYYYACRQLSHKQSTDLLARLGWEMMQIIDGPEGSVHLVFKRKYLKSAQEEENDVITQLSKYAILDVDIVTPQKRKVTIDQLDLTRNSKREFSGIIDLDSVEREMLNDLASEKMQKLILERFSTAKEILEDSHGFKLKCDSLDVATQLLSGERVSKASVVIEVDVTQAVMWGIGYRVSEANDLASKFESHFKSLMKISTSSTDRDSNLKLSMKYYVEHLGKKYPIPVELPSEILMIECED